MNKSDWLGTWILRNGRQLKITSNIQDTLLEIGSIYINDFNLLWKEDNGESLFYRDFDLMERVRDAKLTGD